jgi:predicted Zn-dependent peptidase
VTRLLALHARVTLLLLALTGCTARTSDMTDRSDPHTIAVPAAATPTQPLDPSLVSPSLPTPGELIAASDLPAELPEPLPGDPFGVTIHRLKNGLTVYFSVDHEQPRFAAWIAIRAGGRHDPAHSTGLAHYLEHMLFKGTSKLGTLDAAGEAAPGPHRHAVRTAAAREHPRRARSCSPRSTPRPRLAPRPPSPTSSTACSASSASSTSTPSRTDDATVYTTDVPSARLARVGQRRGEQLDPSDLPPVLPRARGRLRGEEHQPRHPRGPRRRGPAPRPVPGPPLRHPDDPRRRRAPQEPRPRRDGRHHRRWYLPNNAAIILAGDLDPAAALAVLEPGLRDLVSGTGPDHPRRRPARPGRPGRARRPRRGRAVRHPRVAHRRRRSPRRARARYVLAELLDNDVCGLLNVRLLLSGELPDAESTASSWSRPATYALTGVARDDQSLAEVERLLRGVVGELKSGAFTQADLDADRAARQIREQMAASRRAGASRGSPTPTSRAGRGPITSRSPTACAASPATTSSASPDLPRRRPRRRAASPRQARPAEDAQAGDHPGPDRPDPAQPVRRRDPRAARPRARATVPDRGPRLRARRPRVRPADRDPQRPQRPVRGRPAVGCRHSSPPAAVPRPRPAGAVRRRQRLAPRRSSAALPARHHVDTDCGADATEISLTGVDTHLEASLALLAAWLRTPRFTDATVSDLLANTLSLRRDEQDDPEALADALAEYARRGEASDVLARPSDRQLRQARGPDLARELQCPRGPVPSDTLLRTALRRRRLRRAHVRRRPARAAAAASPAARRRRPDRSTSSTATWPRPTSASCSRVRRWAPPTGPPRAC